MIKRDKRNVGKAVTVDKPGSIYHGRTGKVAGFRGDFEKSNPWVNVFLDSTNSVWPFPGSILKKNKV